MGILTAFEWLSADGVFDAGNMEDWFFPYDSLERRKFIRQTYDGADALLMGRNTYEMLAPGWAAMADDDMDGLAGVLTHTPKFIATHGGVVAAWGETTILQDNTTDEVAELKQKVGSLLLIGSADLAESLAKAGLIDEYKLLVQPFVMGSGRRFFGEGMRAPVQLVDAKTLEPNMLVLHYRVTR